MDDFKTKDGRKFKKDAIKAEPQPKTVPLWAFVDGLREFSSGHLAGLMEVDSAPPPQYLGNIYIDLHYVASLFKELLMIIHGEEILYTAVHSRGAITEIEICFSAIKELNGAQVSRIKELAGKSGFYIEITDKIILKTDACMFGFMLVYAISMRDIQIIFENVMFD